MLDEKKYQSILLEKDCLLISFSASHIFMSAFIHVHLCDIIKNRCIARKDQLSWELVYILDLFHLLLKRCVSHLKEWWKYFFN